MLEFIYDWMENISVYLVILIAVIQMIPKNTYEKYIRFFAGLVLILLLSKPILGIFGVSDYDMKYQMENAMQEIEEIMSEGERFGE